MAKRLRAPCSTRVQLAGVVDGLYLVQHDGLTDELLHTGDPLVARHRVVVDGPSLSVKNV